MNLYLVTCDQGLTGNYHSGGAMLVYASSEEDAIAVFHENRKHSRKHDGEDKLENMKIVLVECKERGCIAVMPDAGCC